VEFGLNGARQGVIVLLTNRKLHTGFRLVSKSVTLNVLDRRPHRFTKLF